jgi:hypothetical protein
MIDRYGICNSGAEYNDDNGEWVLYEDAAARISELEAALSGLMPYVNTSKEAAQMAANERQDTPTSDAVAVARIALEG